MITFADLGPVPTVHLFLRVPVPLDHGGWRWGEHPRAQGCMVREYAYNARECQALVMVYGRMTPTLLDRQSLGPRFSVMARGPVTGMVLGLAEWAWSASERAFTQSSEYMCGWRPAARTYYVKTGQLIERQRFDANVAAPPLMPFPARGELGRAA